MKIRNRENQLHQTVTIREPRPGFDASPDKFPYPQEYRRLVYSKFEIAGSKEHSFPDLDSTAWLNRTPRHAGMQKQLFAITQTRVYQL